MITLRQLKAGATLDVPIYREKKYVIIGVKERVVLASRNTIEELVELGSYYDDCEVDIRRHDLYMNNNEKISDAID